MASRFIDTSSRMRKTWGSRGFHADDAFGRQRVRPRQNLGILVVEDVIGHHADLIADDIALHSFLDQRRLAGPTGPPSPMRKVRV
jgi:hypothetical protein